MTWRYTPRLKAERTAKARAALTPEERRELAACERVLHNGMNELQAVRLKINNLISKGRNRANRRSTQPPCRRLI